MSIGYETMSDNEIDQARVKLVFKSNILAFASFPLLLGSIFLGICTAKTLKQTFNVSDGTFAFTVFVFFLIGVASSMWCAFESMYLSKLQAKLAPANRVDDHSCADALHMVAKSTRAKNWVEKVNAQGRQLRVFDIDEVRRLYTADQLPSPAEMNNQACLQLHSI